MPRLPWCLPQAPLHCLEAGAVVADKGVLLWALDRLPEGWLQVVVGQRQVGVPEAGSAACQGSVVHLSLTPPVRDAQSPPVDKSGIAPLR